jgi:hypothetical protein
LKSTNVKIAYRTSNTARHKTEDWSVPVEMPRLSFKKRYVLLDVKNAETIETNKKFEI